MVLQNIPDFKVGNVENLLVNIHWLKISDTNTVYIFRGSSKLLIQRDDDLEENNWENLGENKFLVSNGKEKYILEILFIDTKVLIISHSNSNNYDVYINSNEKNLASIESVDSYLRTVGENQKLKEFRRDNFSTHVVYSLFLSFVVGLISYFSLWSIFEINKFDNFDFTEINKFDSKMNIHVPQDPEHPYDDLLNEKATNPYPTGLTYQPPPLPDDKVFKEIFFEKYSPKIGIDFTNRCDYPGIFEELFEERKSILKERAITYSTLLGVVALAIILLLFQFSKTEVIATTGGK